MPPLFLDCATVVGVLVIGFSILAGLLMAVGMVLDQWSRRYRRRHPQPHDGLIDISRHRRQSSHPSHPAFDPHSRARTNGTRRNGDTAS